MRLQSLPGPFSLYASIRGQVASKNLDISEKMELGGAYAVRAYPEGEAYADQGYVLTVEGRMLLPRILDEQTGQMHLVGFVDTGSVTLNKNPWFAGQNTQDAERRGRRPHLGGLQQLRGECVLGAQARQRDSDFRPRRKQPLLDPGHQVLLNSPGELRSSFSQRK